LKTNKWKSYNLIFDYRVGFTNFDTITRKIRIYGPKYYRSRKKKKIIFKYVTNNHLCQNFKIVTIMHFVSQDYFD